MSRTTAKKKPQAASPARPKRPGRAPLPRCEGPKLHAFAFRDDSSPITFLAVIGHAVHSYVFKVSIEGRIYALKFKYLQTTQYWPYLKGGDRWPGGMTGPKDVYNLCHPFSCECRAYGRLKETENEHAAVKAYGYVFLDARDEETISRDLEISDWGRPGAAPYDLSKPLQGIVKEYIESDVYFTPKMVPAMMKNLRTINSVGIQVYDIKQDNYLNGILIDLSQARTVPHFFVDLNDKYRRTVRAQFAHDIQGFDSMISDWNKDHPQEEIRDAFVSAAWRRRLRPLPHRLAPRHEIPLPRGYKPPPLYDWRKAIIDRNREKKKRRAAERRSPV